MLRFIKQMFIGLLSFGRSLVSELMKCVSINNELCLARSYLIDLNSNELHYCLFMVSLYRSNYLSSS